MAKHRQTMLEQASAAMMRCCDDGERVEVGRELFLILARYSIDHASDWHSLSGMGELVGAVLLPEFRALLSPELVRQLDDRFPESL